MHGARTNYQNIDGARTSSQNINGAETISQNIHGARRTKGFKENRDEKEARHEKLAIFW